MKFLFSSMVIAMLFAGLAKAEAGQKSALPDYSLSVTCDTGKGLLNGSAVISFPDGAERAVSVGGLRILSASFNGNPLPPPAVTKKDNERVVLLKGKGTLRIAYQALFPTRPEAAQNLENAGVVSQNLLGKQGISLTSAWYPRMEELAYYHLKAVVPAGFKAVSEADEITEQKTPEGDAFSFSFPHPLEGLDLVAAPYDVSVEKYGDMDIYAYFLPADKDLAEDYLAHARQYFALYDGLLVPYPYKRFSIVENILPTGYSMPTFTLLGQVVVRLPFITKTSLGHEILHQWFGNYVYGDPASGNWLEAITTYMADQFYQAETGKGWEYRKNVLTDYRAYVTPSKEFPLKDFRGRVDLASMSIGYGKGSMVFHMLKKMLGEKTYYKALRNFIEEKKFKEASWADLEKSFENAKGEGLNWFFDQWLDRKDVPSLVINSPDAGFVNGTPTVTFEVVQKTPPYRLYLPVTVATDKGRINKTIEITAAKQDIKITLPENDKPLGLVVDGNYDIMREISDKEFPPVIARLIGAEKKLIVYPEAGKEKYRGLIKTFESAGFTPREEKTIKDADIESSSLLVLGFDSPVLKRLFGRVNPAGPGFTLVVRRNPLSPDKVVAFANAGSAQEAALVAPKLFHYGNYSLLRFEDGRNVRKETEKTDRGMVETLSRPVFGVEPGDSLTLDRIVAKNIAEPIIYVGEQHDSYADHMVELEVIADLARAGRKFAIGMEMFQRPSQPALDKYINGQIGEREFLKESEYFKRWGMDYLLYRDIINFARARKIPVIALNIRQGIVRKVVKGGLDSLTPQERKEVPAGMDMSDYKYREKIKEVFEQHKGHKHINFENFYQSQILWDETMAHSIADYLKAHPARQMVALAGAQHVMFNEGIPNRAYRLTGKKFVTIINKLGAEYFEPDTGSYVVFAPYEKAPAAPMLGVVLTKKEGRVEIEDVQPGSNAARAGLKKGDVILDVDNWPVNSIFDAKIALVDKKTGDTFNVKVMRERFLFGETTLQLPVTIQ